MGTAQGWGVFCERGRLQSARARQYTHTHNDTLHTHTHTHTQPYTPPPLAPHAPPAGEEQTPGEGSAAPYKTEGLPRLHPPRWGPGELWALGEGAPRAGSAAPSPAGSQTEGTAGKLAARPGPAPPSRRCRPRCGGRGAGRGAAYIRRGAGAALLSPAAATRVRAPEPRAWSGTFR